MSSAKRTQAQRRAETVDALLDATLASLIEVGYAGTSTRGVAERAGVSQGAQQYYFPSKAALVDAAISRLGEQLFVEFAAAPEPDATEREIAAAMLDGLWRLHRLPITPAVFELFNVARTDGEIARSAVELMTAGMDAFRRKAKVLLPTYAASPGFDSLLDMVVATVRGIALAASIPGAAPDWSDWTAIRPHLLNCLDALDCPGAPHDSVDELPSDSR
ncbi:TetR/AcrR family transcriptional regulator [Nocardia sp. CS682]|uniref:TetR/AcrR family transcriptional regulator n=1 Tax=Nocardia sp. CS682 TaxID=1047172 RepID=UPI0014306F6D|nr:TetR/AcrR family transcriptional regulator [Nocardia sp. CS682]